MKPLATYFNPRHPGRIFFKIQMPRPIREQILNTAFMTGTINGICCSNEHTLISQNSEYNDTTEEPFGVAFGDSVRRIGYFRYTSNMQPIVLTELIGSKSNLPREVVSGLIERRGPFGPLLREHVQEREISSKRISAETTSVPLDFREITTEKELTAITRIISAKSKPIAKVREYIF